MNILLENCVDDILFLEMSTEMHQDAMTADITYLDPLMESDMGIDLSREENPYV